MLELENYRKSFVFNENGTEYNLSYLEYGVSNKETIVCVHGLIRNSSDYHFFAKTLEKNYHIISIDMLGRGSSSSFKEASEYHYTHYLEILIKFLDSLALEQVIWFGTSMGGILGIMLCEQEKKYIKKLILNDIGPFVPMDASEKIVNFLRNTQTFFETKDEIYNKVKNTFRLFGINEKNEDKLNFFIENSITQDNGRWRFNYDKKILENFDPDDSFNKSLRIYGLWDNWAKINIPILLIWGKQSNMLRIETIRKMSENKNLLKISVENAGHTPHLMENNLNELIYKWLNNELVNDQEIKI